MSAAWPRRLKHRFYGDRMITTACSPTLVGHVVASLDKALYDDYLCLVALNKQQIQW